MQKNEKRMRAIFLAAVTCFGGTVYATDPPVKTYQIGPQSVSAALKAFAAQSNMQLIFTEADVGSAKTTGVVGTRSPREALSQILKGTGLEFEFTANNVVVVRKPSVSTRSAVSDPPGDESPTQKEGKNSSSQDFRMAQVDQGKTSSVSPLEDQNEQPGKKRPVQVEEIVVTGSRIPTSTAGPQEVQVYNRDTIDQSGQTTVADFVNTLPAVSVSSHDNGLLGTNLNNSIQLHGLPLGTTLTLIDGHRIEASGSSAGTGEYFDLNNIPLSAIERIEVLPSGSSAIYGADALAGVVNFVLKKDLTGFEANAGYGGASGYNEQSADFAWGTRWDHASFSIIGTIKSNSELEGTERAITANNNYTIFGGTDQRLQSCDPGNVFSPDGITPLPGAPGGSNATYAAVSPNAKGGTPSLSNFTYGTLNNCNYNAYSSLIPKRRQYGMLAQGSIELTPFTELFTQVLANRTEITDWAGPPLLFGIPGFQQFTVSGSNPYNPFGETVGVGYSLSDLGRLEEHQNTDFVRALIGVRGNFHENWHWELTGTFSEDRSSLDQARPNNDAIQTALNSTDPATAVNPFTAGAAASPKVLSSLEQEETAPRRGQLAALNGFVRAPVLELPAGSVQLVLGGEYERADLHYGGIQLAGASLAAREDYHRENYSFFGEARIPLLGSQGGQQSPEILTATLAGRYDHYSDFGGTTNPQFGLEIRPAKGLLIRGTYSKAFQAPTLTELYFPQTTAQSRVADPLNGGAPEAITLVDGGNPGLKPETGRSWTLGGVYSSEAIPGFQMAVTGWDIAASNVIQPLDSQTIVDNASYFPGDVIRASSCASGAPCPITEVNATYVNFGDIRVRGIDYQVNYRKQTTLGEIDPSVSVTQTYDYSAALTPSAPAVDSLSRAQDTGNWAPRWKGTATLGWKLGVFSASVAGRYVGKYQDYDSTTNIGNFWTFDTYLRCAVGQLSWPGSIWLKGAYVSVGGVNIFNRLPQYSNFNGGTNGYDPAEADIRGRLVYIRLGARY